MYLKTANSLIFQRTLPTAADFKFKNLLRKKKQKQKMDLECNKQEKTQRLVGLLCTSFVFQPRITVWLLKELLPSPPLELSSLLWSLLLSGTSFAADAIMKEVSLSPICCSRCADSIPMLPHPTMHIHHWNPLAPPVCLSVSFYLSLSLSLCTYPQAQTFVMMISLLVAPASPKTQEQQGIQQFGRKIRKTSNNTYNTHTHTVNTALKLSS
jgi:hypothetical protein